MIAGVVEHHGRRYRVTAHHDALGRLAAAASLGIDGQEGQAEVSRFFLYVIDKRDRQRYLRHVRRQPGEDILGAKCIAVILAHAARSEDAETQRWAADFRAAIVAFRAGQTSAFTDLAVRNAQRYAGVA